MKEYYRTRCKGCDRSFKTKKLKKMVIQSLEAGMPLELEIDIANVIQNNYHQEVETPKGKLVLDLKDMELGLICPHCKEDHKYTLRSLVLSDRLD